MKAEAPSMNGTRLRCEELEALVAEGGARPSPVTEHLRTCARCAALDAVDAWVARGAAELRAVSPPPHAVHALRGELARALQARRARRPLVWLVASGAVAVAALALVLLLPRHEPTAPLASPPSAVSAAPVAVPAPLPAKAAEPAPPAPSAEVAAQDWLDEGVALRESSLDEVLPSSYRVLDAALH